MYISNSREGRLTFDASCHPRLSFLFRNFACCVVYPTAWDPYPLHPHPYPPLIGMIVACISFVRRMTSLDVSVFCGPREKDIFILWYYPFYLTTRIETFSGIFILLHFFIFVSHAVMIFLWYSFRSKLHNNELLLSLWFFFFVSRLTWHFTNDFTVCRIAMFYILAFMTPVTK